MFCNVIIAWCASVLKNAALSFFLSTAIQYLMLMIGRDGFSGYICARIWFQAWWGGDVKDAWLDCDSTHCHYLWHINAGSCKLSWPLAYFPNRALGQIWEGGGEMERGWEKSAIIHVGSLWMFWKVTHLGVRKYEVEPGLWTDSCWCVRGEELPPVIRR